MLKLENFITVFAMKRTGHHAIISWLLKQFPPPKYFLNDRIPYKDIFNQKFDKIKKETKKDNFLSEDYKNSIEDKTLIINYENFDIRNLKNDPKIIPNEKEIIDYKKKYNIIIIRDPFNQFASRIKDINRSNCSDDVDSKLNLIWKEYAKEYLNINNYINNKICISYNKWMTDKQYRKNICDKLEINLSNDDIEEIPYFAGGSSFDRLKFQGRASEMKTLERWKYFENDNKFKNLLNDKELLKLSNDIFGKMQGNKMFKSKIYL